jgi:hypothetical protein
MKLRSIEPARYLDQLWDMSVKSLSAVAFPFRKPNTIERVTSRIGEWAFFEKLPYAETIVCVSNIMGLFSGSKTVTFELRQTTGSIVLSNGDIKDTCTLDEEP